MAHTLLSLADEDPLDTKRELRRQKVAELQNQLAEVKSSIEKNEAPVVPKTWNARHLEEEIQRLSRLTDLQLAELE